MYLFSYKYVSRPKLQLSDIKCQFGTKMAVNRELNLARLLSMGLKCMALERFHAVLWAFINTNKRHGKRRPLPMSVVRSEVLFSVL